MSDVFDNPQDTSDGLDYTQELEAILAREQQRAVELAYLYQIALDLMSQMGTSIPDTVNLVLRNLLNLLACKESCLFLWDEDKRALMPIQACSQSAPDNTYWPESEFIQEVWSVRHALVRNRPSTGSHLGCLLVVKDVPMGLLTAHRPAFREPFGDNEIQLATLVAGLCATMISNVRLQRYLSERLNLLQTVLDASPSGQIVIENGRLLMANPAALTMLNLTLNHYGEPFKVESPDGDLWERLAEARASLTTRFEFRMYESEERVRYLQIDVASVSGERALIQLNDITFIKELELRREQAVSHTSHELKTPLAVMNLGLSNLLAFYDRMPDEERRVMIEETLEQVSEMKSLISRFLDASRGRRRVTRVEEIVNVPEPDQGRVDDPDLVIGQVVTDLGMLALISDIRVTWTPTAIPLTIHCNLTDLKTIIRNLLSNAIKYTPDGGQVDVSSKLVDSTYLLIVRDTGVGIPEDEIPRIFERRFRASTRGNVEGSGIGLSLVREILTRIGGRVDVVSQVGVGSTFTATFRRTT
jgi:signal transduction histidine kinase